MECRYKVTPIVCGKSDRDEKRVGGRGQVYASGQNAFLEDLKLMHY